MNTFINHENHNVNNTLSFHTETILYQKKKDYASVSDFQFQKEQYQHIREDF